MQAAREIAAAASALGAYLTTVLPRARRELRRWGPLPRDKALNAEAVAVFATLAPRARRGAVVRAIVALQVAIDLRDEIEEGGSSAKPNGAAELEKLEAVWRREAATLPSHAAVAPLLEQAVKRCEQGQIHTHAAATGETERLRIWAEGLKASAGYRWWEVAAGASSSVAAHALIAAAASTLTNASIAAQIDAAYHPPTGALTVFLDDLVDRNADAAAGEHNYLGYYASSGEAAERLALLAGRAEASLDRLQSPARHRAILAGVAGFYLSAAGTEAPYAQPARGRLLATLGPGARFLSAFMRVRRLGDRKRPGRVGNPPGP